jgi:hypothetical protein
MLLDVTEWLVTESAMEAHVDSSKGSMRGGESPVPKERSDGRECMGERDTTIGGTSSHSPALVGISHPSGSVLCAASVSLDEKAKIGLSDRSVGRPADGGVQRLVWFCAGDRGEHGDENSINLGEDMIVRKDEPV